MKSVLGNVPAVAGLTKCFNLPTILTTGFEDGPNGPLVSEHEQAFPKAPFIPRPGPVNAWDDDDFVPAVNVTGRNQLIIAGVVTEVCIAFLALSAIADGCDVFVATTDATGTFNEFSRLAACDRVSAAGVQLMTWCAPACVLHCDWRNDESLGGLFSNHIPDYSDLINSFTTLKSAKAA